MYTILQPVRPVVEYTPCGRCRDDPARCPFRCRGCAMNTASARMTYAPNDDTLTFIVHPDGDAMRSEDV